MRDLLEEAFDHYGIEEITGSDHNPDIVGFFDEIGHSWVRDDETAWCSAFINYIAKRTGYERSGQLTARSWLDVGTEIETPERGCIVVLWRGSLSSWKGHVGLYINSDDRYIYILGGNQDNSVCIKRYPKERLLSYRKLNKT